MRPKSVFAAMLLVLSLILIILSISQRDQVDSYKGTWIWETPSALQQADEILEFSRQNGITHMYLHIDRHTARPEQYAQFIEKASGFGIRVEALAGDPSWGRTENRHHIRTFMEWVVSYNTNVERSQQFSGIHLDIEPYLLPEWDTEQELVVKQWLSNLEYTMHMAGWLGGIEVILDVPFWIDRIKVPGYEQMDAGTWMLKRFDTLVLMDYRNRAEGKDGIVYHAQATLKAAEELNKSVVIGVDTAPSNEGAHTTFYGTSTEQLEQELAIARRHLMQYRSFRGMAIHGFPHWMHAYKT